MGRWLSLLSWRRANISTFRRRSPRSGRALPAVLELKMLGVLIKDNRFDFQVGHALADKQVHPDVGSEQKPEEEPDEVKHSQGEWIPDTPEPVSREGTECG